MSLRRLYLLIEGDDDERFLRQVIKPVFERKYDLVAFWRYAEEKTRRIKAFIDSVKAMRADYLFLCDLDDAPCVTAKKEKLKAKASFLDKGRIVVVGREVEGWYLAGLSHDHCQKLGIPYLSSTEAITKEDFDRMIPRKFISRVDFMQEILKLFSLDTATAKNGSLQYLLEKHDP